MHRRIALTLALVLAAPMAAACGQSGGATTNATQALASATATETAAAGARVEPAACAHDQLRVSLGRGDGAAGHVYWPIVFTNVSAAACTLRGYPGVSAVGGNDGHQVGTPARREPRSVSTVTLSAHGGTASALLAHTDADIPAANLCHKAQVRGFRVFAPGQRLAFYLPQPHTTCRLSRFGDTIRPVVHGQTGQ
jgi:Protein of unknown function (DUF4232)